MFIIRKEKAAPVPRTSFVLLFWIFATVSRAQNSADEKLVLENAGTLSSQLISGQVVRMLEGNVRFRQGSMTLTCDRAVQYTREQRTVFRNRVRIRDGEKTLTAQQVTYLARDEVYRAEGNVVYRDGPTTLRADQLTYFREDRKVVAHGNVEVVQEDERLVLTAGHGEYFRDEDYIRVTREPVLVQLDSLGRENTRITGRMMESFDGGRRLRITGEVNIFHQETRAQCDLAEYYRDEEKFVLLKNPVAWQENNELRGDTIELYFQNRKVRQVHVLARAIATSPPDSAAGAGQPNVLKGQKIVFYLRNEKVYKIVVEGTATSIYNMIEDGRFQGINWVQGDRITLYVENNTVRRALIESDPGQSTGKFLPPGVAADSSMMNIAEPRNQESGE